MGNNQYYLHTKYSFKIILFGFLICLPLIAKAEYKLSIFYPLVKNISPEGGLLNYLHYVYVFGLITVGLTALLGLTIGGFLYLTADSITSTEEAKSWIYGAVTGLILALGAYLILYTINPDLVKWKLNIADVTPLAGHLECINNICVNVLGKGQNSPGCTNPGSECNMIYPSVCNTNGDCGPCEACINNACIPQYTPPCQICKNGQVRNFPDGTDCPAGYCKGGICVKCIHEGSICYPQNGILNCCPGLTCQKQENGTFQCTK